MSVELSSILYSDEVPTMTLKRYEGEKIYIVPRVIPRTGIKIKTPRINPDEGLMRISISAREEEYFVIPGEFLQDNKQNRDLLYCLRNGQPLDPTHMLLLEKYRLERIAATRKES